MVRVLGQGLCMIKMSKSFSDIFYPLAVAILAAALSISLASDSLVGGMPVGSTARFLKKIVIFVLLERVTTISLSGTAFSPSTVTTGPS